MVNSISVSVQRGRTTEFGLIGFAFASLVDAAIAIGGVMSDAANYGPLRLSYSAESTFFAR